MTLGGIGTIVGAGIYVLIGEAAGRAGNAVWLAFAISATLAIFTALSYAELSSMYPHAGAEYAYTEPVAGRRWAFLVGWLVMVTGIAASATVALGFAGYLNALVPIDPIFAAAGLIIVLSFVLLYGIRETAYIAAAFTLIEVAGLLLIIAAGIPYLGQVDYFVMPFGIRGLLSASALVFFAYIGFEQVVKFSEETRSPEKTVPMALILALAVSILLYVLVAVSSVSVLGWEQLATSQAPFVDVAAVVWGGNASFVLNIIALGATLNTVLLMLYASSRVGYGMARERALPTLLSWIHPGRKTPWPAVIISAAGALLFTLAGEVALVAAIANFLIFATFVIINGVVIALRIRDPSHPRPFRIPGSVRGIPVLPFCGMAASFGLFLQLDLTAILIGLAISVAGAFLSGVTDRQKDGTGAVRK